MTTDINAQVQHVAAMIEEMVELTASPVSMHRAVLPTWIV